MAEVVKEMMEDRRDSSAVESTDKHPSQHEAKESWTAMVKWEGGKRESSNTEQGRARKEGGRG